MNLAKISANGQITVPAEIRKQLNLKNLLMDIYLTKIIM